MHRVCAQLRKCVAELAKVAVANAALVARHDAAKAVTAAKLSDAARRREAHMDQVRWAVSGMMLCLHFCVCV